MGSTQFGNFHNFCRDSTLPVCNLFPGFSYADPSGFEGSCQLTGIPISGGKHLGNLGSIIIALAAIAVTAYLVRISDRKLAAVGRREMQIFLFIYALTQICEIFTVGLFPLERTVRIVLTSLHLGLIVACLWVLLLNAIVGYQLWDDGTPQSVGFTAATGSILFFGTGYIALDTGLSITGYFDSSLSGQNRNIGLYILYQFAPLIFIFGFFALESFLVIRVLGEIQPMIYLTVAALLFFIAQLFNYVVSTHICHASSGKINGALFETLFTLLSVMMVWVFWSSITEDSWPDQNNITP